MGLIIIDGVDISQEVSGCVVTGTGFHNDTTNDTQLWSQPNES